MLTGIVDCSFDDTNDIKFSRPFTSHFSPSQLANPINRKGLYKIWSFTCANHFPMIML